MIAMSMTSTHDEDRGNASASAPVYPAPAHPLRRAMMHALAMFGLGMGSVAAVDDDEALGIG
jgi:hypothetical protein